MKKSPSRSPRAAVARGLAFAAVMAAGFPLLADVPAAPTAAEPAVPAAAPEAEPPAAAPAQRRTTEAPGETSRNAASDVENDLRRDFNDLRRELLDHRMKLVDWWLIVMAGILTVGGYLGFRRFREVEVEARGNVDTARGHAEEARRLVDEIKERRDEADSLVRGMTAETATAEPDKADEAVRSAQADPSASPIDRAVSAAILSQRQGNIEEAIEKWRAVAGVADGTDAELGARAWFSIGYLHGKESRHQEAVDAYDKAIRRKPGMAKAYHNRGVMKRHLRRYEDAIADYDEAIKRDPNYAKAYYNRARARFTLGYKDEALRDFKRARALARATGDEAIADRASRQIERLFGGGDP